MPYPSLPLPGLYPMTGMYFLVLAVRFWQIIFDVSFKTYFKCYLPWEALPDQHNLDSFPHLQLVKVSYAHLNKNSSNSNNGQN